MQIRERLLHLLAIVAISSILLAGLFIIVDNIEPVPIRPGATGSSVSIELERVDVGIQPGT